MIDLDNSDNDLDNTGMNEQVYILDSCVSTIRVQSHISNEENSKDTLDSNTSIKHEEAD